MSSATRSGISFWKRSFRSFRKTFRRFFKKKRHLKL